MFYIVDTCVQILQFIVIRFRSDHILGIGFVFVFVFRLPRALDTFMKLNANISTDTITVQIFVWKNEPSTQTPFIKKPLKTGTYIKFKSVCSFNKDYVSPSLQIFNYNL